MPELETVAIFNLPLPEGGPGCFWLSRCSLRRRLRRQEEPRANCLEKQMPFLGSLGILPYSLPASGGNADSSQDPSTPWNRHAEITHTESHFSECRHLLVGMCCGETLLFPLPFPGQSEGYMRTPHLTECSSYRVCFTVAPVKPSSAFSMPIHRIYALTVISSYRLKGLVNL